MHRKPSIYDTYMDKAVTALNNAGVIWMQLPEDLRENMVKIDQRLTRAANKKALPQYMKLVNHWRDTILKEWKIINPIHK